MTREIKFRAWDKIEELMHYQENGSEGVEFSFGGMNCVRVYEYTPQLIDGECINDYDYDELEDVVIMQYTGLKDKNGKEIFEGDIVKIARHIDNDVVIFKDGAFCIEGWTNTLVELMTDWSSNVDPELIEVIGNVHENPELLKDN